MKKKPQQKSPFLKVSLFALLMLALSLAVFAQQTTGVCSTGESYIEGLGCYSPSISVTKKFYELPSNNLPSAISDYKPLKINNPYAVQGQPVVVEFTLTNDGDQRGYPFNQIILPPDMYSLILSVDKSGIVDENGRVIDLKEELGIARYLWFILSTGFGEFGEWSQQQLGDKQCGYVDISEWERLPEGFIEEITGDKDTHLYKWECLKITSLPTYLKEVSSYCNAGIDEECLSDYQNSIRAVESAVWYLGDTAAITLTGDPVSEMDTERHIFGDVISCGIGDKGLQAGESTTCKFVVLVPRDTPVTTMEALVTENAIKGNVDEENMKYGYTASLGCEQEGLSEENQIACHSLEGEIYPLKSNTLIGWLTEGIQNKFKFGGCAWTEVISLGESNFMNCLSRPDTDDGAGSPIARFKGIFFVLAPSLHAEVTMLLWLAFIMGAVTPLGLKQMLGK